ncbi:hypothetical protein [Nostoc sp. LPT]|uniref:hypothetical protein n=1 Tax=Nostoc sp. LPT TaxID=2815387 RepID=UPI001D426317|nr:hypothetical protein [Nostoc sp. LPT]MBN4004179.1 hypothetical protein [Nostoc sp. LPT]
MPVTRLHTGLGLMQRLYWRSHLHIYTSRKLKLLPVHKTTPSRKRDEVRKLSLKQNLEITLIVYLNFESHKQNRLYIWLKDLSFVPH